MRYTGHKERRWDVIDSQCPLDWTVSLQRKQAQGSIGSALLSFFFMHFIFVFMLVLSFYFVIFIAHTLKAGQWKYCLTRNWSMVQKMVGDCCLRSKTILILWCCETVFVFCVFFFFWEIECTWQWLDWQVCPTCMSKKRNDICRSERGVA